MNRLEPIVEQVRTLIIEKLNVRLPAKDFHAHTPLFGGGLELNSFAVVDLIGQLERQFHFQFREADFREETFRNLESLAELIDRYRTADMAITDRLA